MASFIDCYNSLETLISNISINKSSSYISKACTEEQALQKRVANILHLLVERIEPKYSVDLQYCPHSHAFTLSQLGDQLGRGLVIFLKMEISLDTYQLLISNTVLKNHLPLRVCSSEMRLSVSRYLFRLNSAMKYGTVRVEPCSGEVGFCMNSMFSLGQLQQLSWEPYKFIQLMEEEMLKSKFYVHMHLHKILHLVN